MSFLVPLLLSLATNASVPVQERPEDPPGLWQRDANLGLGLFQSASMSPIPSLRTGFAPRLPSSIAGGEFELRVNEDWATVLSTHDEWVIDYDVLRTNLALSWGLSDRLRLDADYETATRTSGTLDTFIIAFHRTFNLALENRRQYQNHPQTLQIQPRDGGSPVMIDKSDPQPFQQAFLVGGQYSLVPGDDEVPAVAVSLTLRRVLTPGDVTLGSPIDVGASLSLAKSLGPLNFYVGASAAWFGQEELSGLPLRGLMWSGIAGVEARCFPWMSVTGQYLITSGGVDALSHLSRPSHEITAGFKWDLSGGVLLELGVIENILDFYNSPDFGVHFGMAARW
jgi:hypothetical protein